MDLKGALLLQAEAALQVPLTPRGCTPASCVGCAPRRACERRAAVASWQVALAAAKFAGLWILDSTLVS